ncbi:MAG: hypothetical protein HQL77_17360 [Magnetococcales bacterium]|nr:hypothetical protein [Magnetococcales bacterium]
MKDVIVSLNEEFKSIIDFLDQNNQPSLSSYANKHFKKIIILSSASYFEDIIQKKLIDFISHRSNNNKEVVSFLRKKAIDRQYHTFFDWDKNNANKFLSLFGDDFKTKIGEEINHSEEITKAMKAFLEMGQLRNTLVHNNFAKFNIENKTIDEIIDLYKKSMIFVRFLEEKLIST